MDEKQTAFMHEAMPFAVALGVEVVSAAPEEVRARVAWDASKCTSGGALHGGVLMGLADACGGMSAFLNLPEGATGTTTIESKTNFLRAVKSGTAEAIARPLHVGSGTVVVETEITNDHHLVAKVTQTQVVLEARTNT